MKNLIAWLMLLAASNSTCAQGIERLLNINNTELNVRIVGEGSPILIVHGGPGLNHTYFLPHLNKLASSHKLIFIDQRACGKSSGTIDSTQMSIDWLVSDMEAVRKELKLGKISVLAHSWGGLLGVLYAARYPENLHALIVVSTVSMKAGEFDQQTNATVSGRYSKADSTLRAQTLNSDAFKAGDIDAFSLLFQLSFKQSFYDQRYIDSLHLELPSDFIEKRKVIFFMAKELFAYEFYPLLKNIRCPTLLVHGDYDAIPLQIPQKILTEIPNSKLVVIKEAGHFPFIEKNKEFIGQINQFLNSH
jgi:proline iminopeptidase